MTTDRPFHSDASMGEKAEGLRNDQAQYSTYHQQAASTVGQELGGRFSHLARGQQQIVGTAPIAYPAQPPGSPWGNSYILPDEPPTGVDLNWVGDMTTVDGAPPSSAPIGVCPPNGSAVGGLVASSEPSAAGSAANSVASLEDRSAAPSSTDEVVMSQVAGKLRRW
jgi:hypothetical protein